VFYGIIKRYSEKKNPCFAALFSPFSRRGTGAEKERENRLANKGFETIK